MTCQWSSIRLVLFVGQSFPFWEVCHMLGCSVANITTYLQFQFYYRNLSRQQAQQQAWLQKRRYSSFFFRDIFKCLIHLDVTLDMITLHALFIYLVVGRRNPLPGMTSLIVEYAS